MNSRTKLIVVSMTMIVLAAVILPRVVRQIDSAVDPFPSRPAANEVRYRDMTNALRTAGELLPDHPTRRFFEECRAELLQAGYIETKEIPMASPPERRWSAGAFFNSFWAKFPGAECKVRGNRAGQPPVVEVTARKSDLPAIEKFIRSYEPTR